eukprot:1157803-Pelagomonas_calceolata.AAC.2
MVAGSCTSSSSASVDAGFERRRVSAGASLPPTHEQICISPSESMAASISSLTAQVCLYRLDKHISLLSVYYPLVHAACDASSPSLLWMELFVFQKPWATSLILGSALSPEGHTGSCTPGSPQAYPCMQAHARPVYSRHKLVQTNVPLARARISSQALLETHPLIFSAHSCSGALFNRRLVALCASIVLTKGCNLKGNAASAVFPLCTASCSRSHSRIRNLQKPPHSFHVLRLGSQARGVSREDRFRAAAALWELDMKEVMSELSMCCVLAKSTSLLWLSRHPLACLPRGP